MEIFKYFVRRKQKQLILVLMLGAVAIEMVLSHSTTRATLVPLPSLCVESSCSDRQHVARHPETCSASCEDVEVVATVKGEISWENGVISASGLISDDAYPNRELFAYLILERAENQERFAYDGIRAHAREFRISLTLERASVTTPVWACLWAADKAGGFQQQALGCADTRELLQAPLFVES